MIIAEEQLLFPWVEKQIQDFLHRHSLKKVDLINLGIGDTCHNLPECIVQALHHATNEMQKRPIGYGDELGDKKFREKICQTVYAPFNFNKDEVMITEGIINSLSHLIHLFPEGSTFGILSPTYPGYKSLLQTSRMKIEEVCKEFIPPSIHLDAMILCSPNNPTGIAFSREELQKWVDWAIDTDTILLFDGAYESFINCPNTPCSIYEIEGAKYVAIELRSFSKSLGFSGLRLGYFTVPKEIRGGSTLFFAHKLMIVRTNGVSYVIQQAGIAALSTEGLAEIARLSAHYMKMTKKLKDFLTSKGHPITGGIAAPYLLWECTGCSKENFLTMLQNHHTITVPGLGFGVDGFLRLSGFINEQIFEKVVREF